MEFGPSVYEPIPIVHDCNTDYPDHDDIDDQIWEDIVLNDCDDGLDALSTLIISYEIPFYGPILDLPENEFLGRMELIDELDIAFCRRQCGVHILRPPIRG